MKVLFLVLSIFTISHSALASNGWSSSGGGEYIIDQNNPWFIGEAGEEVKWCIDHGGADKFSLNFQQSKIEIQNAIAGLTNQLKSINQNTDYMSRPDGKTGQIFRRNKDYPLSDNFVFTQNCNEADVEIILGNYNNPKIQTFINDIGMEKFKKIAGITIRTDYVNLRAKGFIYIAADQGEIQYSGSRNIIFQSKTIWDSYEKIGKNVTFPGKFIEGKTYKDFYKNKKFKDYTMGLLLPIVTHELGHIFGMEHNHRGNVMDEDYPAKAIQQGIVFRNEFKMAANIFGNGLLETHLDKRIGFEWNYINLKYGYAELKEQSDAISELLLNLPVDTKPFSRKELFFIFDLYDGRDNDYNPADEKDSLQIAIYDENYNYKILKKYEFTTELCENPTPVEYINIRTEETAQDSKSWSFNADSQKWVETESQESKIPRTEEILRLDDNHYCGKITVGKKMLKKLVVHFKLTHSYFGDHDLMLTDENGYTLRLDLLDTTIFGNPSAPLPTPDLRLDW